MYLELLGKVVHDDYMGLTRTWWCGCSWYLVHARILMFYNKISCKKMTRHEANVRNWWWNWESVPWVPLPMYKVCWCLIFMLHVTLWHELLMSSFYLYTTKLYYSWHSFPLGYTYALFLKSFQTTIIIG